MMRSIASYFDRLRVHCQTGFHSQSCLCIQSLTIRAFYQCCTLTKSFDTTMPPYQITIKAPGQASLVNESVSSCSTHLTNLNESFETKCTVDYNLSEPSYMVVFSPDMSSTSIQVELSESHDGVVVTPKCESDHIEMQEQRLILMITSSMNHLDSADAKTNDDDASISTLGDGDRVDDSDRVGVENYENTTMHHSSTSMAPPTKENFESWDEQYLTGDFVDVGCLPRMY